MNKNDKEMWELLRGDIKELKDRVTSVEILMDKVKGAFWLASKIFLFIGAVITFVLGVGEIVAIAQEHIWK